jgi:hypothetical protein
MTVDRMAPKKNVKFASAVEGAAVMAAADKVITY